MFIPSGETVLFRFQATEAWLPPLLLHFRHRSKPPQAGLCIGQAVSAARASTGANGRVTRFAGARDPSTPVGRRPVGRIPGLAGSAAPHHAGPDGSAGFTQWHGVLVNGR